MVDGVESRRSARVQGRFWVAVEGVDAELTPRNGDISATGIFVQMDGTEIGEIGTVQWLHIASIDRLMTVHVMAHTVRHVHLTDMNGTLRGVALEFMPESDEAATRLSDFVHYVLANPIAPNEVPHIVPRVRATASAGGTDTQLKELSVNTLVLETDWSVPVGEAVRVEIIARGVRRPIRVEGQAVSILPGRTLPGGPKRFRIAVQVKQEIAGPLRRFSSAELRAVRQPSGSEPPQATIDQLINALIQPPAEPPERKHLSGLLSRIPFTTLCSLLELERLSGELVVRRGNERIMLFVKDGRFVDVAPAPAGPRAVLASLFATHDGSFELDIQAIDREDKVGLSMTNLLLDLARVADEANAPPATDPNGGEGI